jgi:hypothetical protein
MITQNEAIIEALRELGGERTAEEIKAWVEKKYGPKWKDFNTSLADMVAPAYGGNQSSNVPDYFRVIMRVSRGNYCLIKDL